MVPSDLEPMFELACETEEGPQWTRENYRRILMPEPSALLHRFALVAYAGTALAGFGVSSLLRADNVAELEAVIVHAALRRRGLGARLLDGLLFTAAHTGATRMRLEVRESNVAAIALYTGRGFRKIGMRHAYYSAPVENALLLEVELSDVKA